MRQSSIIFYVAITFIYSGGLPVLYPIASIYFFFTYWTDKWLLIKYYKEPPQYSYKMVKDIANTFKFCIVLHFAITYAMYKDPKIMELYPEVIEGFGAWTYFWILGICICIMYLWRTVLRPILNCFKRIGGGACSNK